MPYMHNEIEMSSRPSTVIFSTRYKFLPGPIQPPAMKWKCYYFDENSSQAVLDVIKMKTSSAINDQNFVEMCARPCIVWLHSFGSDVISIESHLWALSGDMTAVAGQIGGKSASTPTMTCVHCKEYASLSHSKLTHWRRMTHICVIKLTIMGSNDCLCPGISMHFKMSSGNWRPFCLDLNVLTYTN